VVDLLDLSRTPPPPNSSPAEEGSYSRVRPVVFKPGGERSSKCRGPCTAEVRGMLAFPQGLSRRPEIPQCSRHYHIDMCQATGYS
jgi:hypothetical protein